MAYFQTHAAKQLLVFHISESSERQLNRFLTPYFDIEAGHFPHHHKSA
jgi:hypothetical protein